MVRKSTNSNAELTESVIKKEIQAADVAILSGIVNTLGHVLSTFAIILEAEALKEFASLEASNASNNSPSGSANGHHVNHDISPDRFRKLEKQVQYLSKEVDRLRG